jgi:hypothetical protein
MLNFFQCKILVTSYSIEDMYGVNIFYYANKMYYMHEVTLLITEILKQGTQPFYNFTIETRLLIVQHLNYVILIVKNRDNTSSI